MIDLKKIVGLLLSMSGTMMEEKAMLFKYDSEQGKTAETILKMDLMSVSKYGFCMDFTPHGRHIYYNGEMDTDQKLFTIAHEVSHLLLNHVHPNQKDKQYNTEWEADMLASMLIFTIFGALPIMDEYRVNC